LYSKMYLHKPAALDPVVDVVAQLPRVAVAHNL